MRLPAILFLAFIATAGYAHPAADSEEDALEEFASRPTAQVAWSQEIDRIEAGGVRAVVRAIEMSDSMQRPSSKRGVRIDLADANGGSTFI